MSETTEVKGQFGLDQSGGTGKKLKIFYFTDMSTRWITPKTSLKQQKLQWINLLCHDHDIFCGCSSPLEHTAALIFEQEPDLRFRPPEKDLIQKCLTTQDTTEGDGDQDAFGEGDLEDLFKEDFGEEDTR